MDLETAKLVAFALWAEAYEGVIGSSPTIIENGFHVFQNNTSIDELRANLGVDLAYKLDNYLTVWEAAEEPDKAFDELESAAAEEQEETPAGEALLEPEEKELSVQEKFARGVKHPMKPMKQKGKRG